MILRGRRAVEARHGHLLVPHWHLPVNEIFCPGVVLPLAVALAPYWQVKLEHDELQVEARVTGTGRVDDGLPLALRLEGSESESQTSTRSRRTRPPGRRRRPGVRRRRAAGPDSGRLGLSASASGGLRVGLGLTGTVWQSRSLPVRLVVPAPFSPSVLRLPVAMAAVPLPVARRAVHLAGRALETSS